MPIHPGLPDPIDLPGLQTGSQHSCQLMLGLGYNRVLPEKILNGFLDKIILTFFQLRRQNLDLSD